jgi:hypothetical protein
MQKSSSHQNWLARWKNMRVEFWVNNVDDGSMNGKIEV